MSNLDKAKKLQSKWESKSIKVDRAEPFTFNAQQKKELVNILKNQFADDVIIQTEKVITVKLTTDGVQKPNITSENKASLKHATGHLLDAMKYLNELDPLAANELPKFLHLARQKESGSIEEQTFKESPMQSLSILIAGIGNFSEALQDNATRDEISFLIVEVARIFKRYNLKPAYSRESKFHRFLIVSLAAIDIIKKDISDIIKARLNQG